MSGFTSLEQYLEFKENISKNYIKNIYCKINNNNNITYGDNNFYSSSNYGGSWHQTFIRGIGDLGVAVATSANGQYVSLVLTQGVVAVAVQIARQRSGVLPKVR